jgi:hypothetical protein
MRGSYKGCGTLGSKNFLGGIMKKQFGLFLTATLMSLFLIPFAVQGADQKTIEKAKKEGEVVLWITALRNEEKVLRGFRKLLARHWQTRLLKSPRSIKSPPMW